MIDTTYESGQRQGWPNAVIINTDGASRGNPGAASLGYTVTDTDSQECLYEFAEYLGEQTNNFAEYMAIKRALESAAANNVEQLTLRSDSELLIRQLTGEYRVKSPTLKPLFLECIELVRKIPKVRFEHVRRENNKRADELANLILDRQ